AFPQHEIETALSAYERQSTPSGELEDFAPMTWDMIGRMHRAGVTIGSHTVSHTLLPTEAIETVNSELAGSRQTLERHLGARVKHFAYPDGRFNPAVVEAVNAAGYRFAYGSCNSRD